MYEFSIRLWVHKKLILHFELNKIILLVAQWVLTHYKNIFPFQKLKQIFKQIKKLHLKAYYFCSFLFSWKYF